MQRISWLIDSAREEWDSLIDHPFPRELAAGTLPLDAFLYYLVQDTYYLEDFLRTVGLLVTKAVSSKLRRFAIGLLLDTVSGELAMHEAIERQYVLSADRPLGQTAPAYGDFLVRQAYQGDDFDIMTALAPCVVSYRAIAVRLERASEEMLPAPYRLWLDSYQGEEYGILADRFLSFMETLSTGQREGRRERAGWIFQKACQFEKLFWDESYRNRVSFSLSSGSIDVKN